ncbi:unnamed protein product [Didymodactylos carnosus]|uniref:Uncharacterized protein n=1 Tax=Didymodactylos carnosus TaxID=1234261 RepID=A0A816ELB3_9BILA|nr:unnamed protein product [Didymodactylos carnosus]CAF4569717.1 unnamed protein product [Didymodactylos carnosus]
MNIPAKNNKPARDVILLPRRQQIGEILKTVLSKIPDDGKRLSDNECVKTLHETNLWISRNRIQMILGLLGDGKCFYDVVDEVSLSEQEVDDEPPPATRPILKETKATEQGKKEAGSETFSYRKMS